ncbi:MAG TPA: erythromycin esterase family protein [Thermoanaerobaculia bacterium]|jgi:erythromycin esterase-like protein|nr:erythromycin esterase family protein [Thermoanaerobaculia bacterium]
MAVPAFNAARLASRDSYRITVLFVLLASLLLTGCLRAARVRTAAAAPGELIAPVREAALPIMGDEADYDKLMDLVGDSRFVLLGDATHGTHEFYRERARITERLIREKGFDAVAIEGDWDDADLVNRYVRGLGNAANAEQALAGFRDFPGWMWGNTDVRDLVEWLRTHNAALPAGERVGFYGLDLYGVVDSADTVVSTLERLDPAAARRAGKRYGCFSRFRGDFPVYGQEAAAHPSRSCEKKAMEQLQEIRSWNATHAAGADPARREELFSLLQHARVVRNGEAYYRVLAASSVSSWNLRDRHMAATLDELAGHLGKPGKPAKIVVWAHSSHLGDASGTQRADFGELNLGQLVRQRHRDDAVLVGFTTYTGTVAAASVWGERGQLKQVRPSLKGSYTALLHEAGIGDSLLLIRGNGELAEALGEPRLERAIGVLYHPQEERRSHYLKTRLSQQFDAVIYFDETRAVERLRTF